MNLLNVKVKHKMFGVGEIIEVNDNYVVVAFSSKTTKIAYPLAFQTFIRAIDDNVQEYIIAEIEKAKNAEQEKKRLEAERRRAEEEKRAAEEAERRAEISRKTGYIPRPVAASQREEGKRMIFWVFQGKSFEKEFRGGYIWAPISNKSGTVPHHWTRLVDVRKGDIILHGCDGMLKAISIAKNACFECKQPKELAVEDLWDTDGRMVECEYIDIKIPIKTSNYVDDIIRLCRTKYSPFDKDGNGNMGYLFEINRELAQIFISETVKRNQYLAAVEYIDNFLKENDN